MPAPQRINVAGRELAGRLGRHQLTVTPSQRRSCPVCRHPTGDCVGESDAMFILAMDDEPTVLVRSDVWVTRPSPGAPLRPMTTLAAAAGQRLPLREVLILVAHGYQVDYVDPATQEPVDLESIPLAIRAAHEPPPVDEEPAQDPMTASASLTSPDGPPEEDSGSPSPEPESGGGVGEVGLVDVTQEEFDALPLAMRAGYRVASAVQTSSVVPVGHGVDETLDLAEPPLAEAG